MTGLDKTLGFGVIWLKDIPDEKELTVSVTIWRAEKDNVKRGEDNVVDDLGENLGTLHVPLKFFRGLGAFHRKLASESPALHDVMEVLSIATESKEIQTIIGGDHLDESDSSSESSDDESPEKSEKKGKTNGFLKKMGMKDSDEEHVNDGKGGPIQQIKGYKMHSDHLHRQNRGLMEHQAPRTAKYVKTKMEHGKNHVMNTFRHHERNPGIETEV